MTTKALDVVVAIGGRTALPIRAIPFSTGWRLSSDSIVSAFAHQTVDDLLMLSGSECGEASENRLRTAMPASLLEDDGTIRLMLPRDWDAPAAAIAALVADDSYQPDNEAARYLRYRQQSIALLPSSVFVWLDQFERAYSRAMKRTLIANERPGDRLLQLRPLVPTELHAVVMDGFIAPAESASEAARRMMKDRAQAACRVIVAAKTSPTFREIVETPAFSLAVNSGRPGTIPVSEKVLRSWIREVYPSIAKGGRPRGSGK